MTQIVKAWVVLGLVVLVVTVLSLGAANSYAMPSGDTNSNTAVPQGRYPASAARAPLTHAQPRTVPPGTATTLLSPQAYSYRFTFNDVNIVTFDLAAPASQTVLAPTTRSLFAGDFANNDFSRLLVIDNATNEYLSIDTATGVETLLGSSIPIADHLWSGMTWDPTTGILYAHATSCAESSLYTIDIATGAATLIGFVSNAGCLIDIAMSPGGQLYGVDIINDVFLAIDKTTGAGTVIGSIGFDANFAQDLDFDDASGVLYYAAFNNVSFNGELYIIDITSGATTFLGSFGTDTTEIDAFGIVSSIPVPTATPEPPTATPEPPTVTPEPPTATPEIPTSTPKPPIPTETFTPIAPPTDVPSDTATPIPSPAATNSPPPGATFTSIPLPTVTGTPAITPVSTPTVTPRPTISLPPSATATPGTVLAVYAPLILYNINNGNPIPTVTPTPVCLTIEQEPNNTIDDVTGYPVVCEGVTARGTGKYFNDPTDPERYDIYRIDVSADTPLAILLDSLRTGETDFDLLLLDSTGAIIAAAQQPGDDCLTTPVVAGTYYIAVYEDPLVGAVPYTLVWQRGTTCSP